MDRRSLLTSLTALAAWLSLGGCARLVAGRQARGKRDQTDAAAALNDQLAELADPHFRDYSTGKSVPELQSALARKGVISSGRGIDHERLTTLARQEPLRLYQGYFYTQTELDLYALAYLLND